MNNKKLGTAWEQECCDILKANGYWVKFFPPDSRGSQPFDIIAVKDGIAKAIDSKTSVSAVFPLSRLEDNQIFAFDLWLECGNTMPEIWVKHKGKLYVICYKELKEKGKVKLQ